ncbi:MAG: hypothetical protein JWL96_725 [Sphingomonas bacterium]|uniref:hypothetical protein n=1 Tax=Sphingomonas bacterium TaxID=1895847 RepID=UPI002608549D|nr:hypothetical protein [Sphingomonas bacterium]MDB5708655.1 hypothetical protein [Sphingomonas bacterium]
MRPFIILALMLPLPALPGRSAADAPGRPSAPSDGQVFTDDYPYDTYRGWVSTSLSEEDSGMPVIHRVRGDGFSRFYYLMQSDPQVGPANEVRSEDGTLLARVGEDATGLGIRKSPIRLTFILYHVSIKSLSRYHLILVERGKARVFACRLDQATFEAAARQHYSTSAALAEAQSYMSNYVINLLQVTEPVLTHCVAQNNGVPRGKPDRQPVLRMAFPHVGDTFISDNSGFKGGWLYGGYDKFGPSKHLCCYFPYDGDGRDAFIVGERVHPGREMYRVRLIFHVDNYVRRIHDCDIAGERAIVAVADEQWKNGRAYLSDGKTLRIVRWTDTSPKGCENPIYEDPGPEGTSRRYQEWARQPR